MGVAGTLFGYMFLYAKKRLVINATKSVTPELIQEIEEEKQARKQAEEDRLKQISDGYPIDRMLREERGTNV